MSPYVNGPDEYLLNKDLHVALWIDFGIHRGETPLKEVCRNDFVVVNNELHQEFDDFKKEQSIDRQQRSIVPLNELIEVYVKQLKWMEEGTYCLRLMTSAYR